MKRQVSVMDVALIVLLAMAALIGIYAASGQVLVQDLPAVQSIGRPINTAVEIKAVAPVTAVDMWDATGKYRTAPSVVKDAWDESGKYRTAPTAASDVWQRRGYFRTAGAPAAASDSSASLERRQYHIIPAASGAKESAVLPTTGLSDAVDMAPYKAVVVSAAGAQEIEYSAPRVNSRAVQERIALPEHAGFGMANYSTVIINPGKRAELLEWTAPKAD